MGGSNGMYQGKVQLHTLCGLCAAAAANAEGDIMFRPYFKGYRRNDYLIHS
jgi:hypothetical protein